MKGLKSSTSTTPEVHVTMIELAHGIFNASSSVLENALRHLKAKGYDPSQFTWIGPEICPFNYTDDPEVVIVLDITLGTLEETFEFAYTWAATGQRMSRWVQFEAGNLKIRILKGAEPFQPFTLRWRQIDIGTNMNRKPCEIRDPKRSPGVALILMLAEHPLIARQTFRWGHLAELYLTGLEWTDDESDSVRLYGMSWNKVPCLEIHSASGGIRLVGYWNDDIGFVVRNRTSPEYIEN